MPGKAASNLKKHGIDFREAATVFADPLLITFPDPNHSEFEQRFLTIGTNIILLEPDIAEAFPNDEAVNQALRGVLNTTRAVRSTGGLAEKSLHLPARRRSRRSRRA